MPPFLPALARRAAGEVERLLSSALAQGQEFLEQGARVARLQEETAAQRERADRLERELAEQAAGLAAAREQVASLVTELNDRLLPRIDERIHETERDLTRLATRLLRVDAESIRRQSRLAAAEQRIVDLRERTGRLEERTGLWRELQANVARLGEDLDALRPRPAARSRETVTGDLRELGGGARNGVHRDRQTPEDLHQ